MQNKGNHGFSIIEILVVVVTIGIIATIAIPYLQKAIRAAEVGNTIATMRVISSTETSFYSQNGRFGRLTEINNLHGNSLGTPSGNEIHRGKFVFSLSPAAPTDADLQLGYTMTATRNVADEGLYVYELSQSGEIRQILP